MDPLAVLLALRLAQELAIALGIRPVPQEGAYNPSETPQEAAKRLLDALAALSEAIAARSAALAREHRAAEAHPALRLPLLLLLASLALASACAPSGRVHRLGATPSHRAGFAVTWPEGVSEDPATFHTVRLDGRMITTAPLRAAGS